MIDLRPVSVAPPWVLVAHGAPRSKKNNMRVVIPKGLKYPRLIPSAAYVAWEKLAVPQLRLQWAGHAALAEPVELRAVFYREKAVGDVTNYLSAISDALEVAGVVEDDKWIYRATGTLAKDAAAPRVELTITRFAE